MPHRFVIGLFQSKGIAEDAVHRLRYEGVPAEYISELLLHETAALPQAMEPEVEAFLPHERLDLTEALDAFTMGTAFLNHLDAETGSIETGKLADLAVLDRNPFEVEPMSIGEVRVLLTLVDGQPVHVNEEIDWPS